MVLFLLISLFLCFNLFLSCFSRFSRFPFPRFPRFLFLSRYVLLLEFLLSFFYPSKIFFAKFAKNGLVDGTATPVTTQFVDSIAVLGIPHFWQQAVLDPDFSVLINSVDESDPKSGDACKPSSQSRKSQVAVGMMVEEGRA